MSFMIVIKYLYSTT